MNYFQVSIFSIFICLEYFVNQLDDNVELVTLDTLITMVEENVPHETVTPD